MASAFTRKSFRVMQGMEKLLKPKEDLQRKYPLLILVGDQDKLLSINLSKSWHKKEKASKFAWIKDAGHCANMDNGPEFNRVLSEFIRLD
jgi:pimeloyl-ACP methyl ester carboxylesterase